MYNAYEVSGHIQLTLALSSPSSMNITVRVTDKEDTAAGKLASSGITSCVYICTTGYGVDYTSGPFYITFPPGDMLFVFNVPITDDDIVEFNESFVLSVDPSSLPAGVTISKHDQIFATIIDDDCKQSFSK